MPCLFTSPMAPLAQVIKDGLPQALGTFISPPGQDRIRLTGQAGGDGIHEVINIIDKGFMGKGIGHGGVPGWVDDFPSEPRPGEAVPDHQHKRD
jgi:hypothetical protein